MLEGIYTFCYCNIHDDGSVLYAPNDSYDVFKYMYSLVCDGCDYYNSTCDYVFKGQLEYKNKKITILSDIELEYSKASRYGGGFEYWYYLGKVQDITSYYKYVDDDEFTNIMTEWLHQYAKGNIIQNIDKLNL